MKKKIFSAVCALLLVMGAASPITNSGGFADLNITASAEESDGNFEYTLLEDGTYEIKSFTRTGEQVIIPSTYNDKNVTSIGDDVFYKCSGITSITIPDTVTNIGSWAFADCTSLENITIPNSVTSIGDGAFSTCSSLTSLTIPNGVTSIGDSAFSSCSSLTSIIIPNGVTGIGSWMFNDCTSLTSLTIPNGVTSIGYCAFNGCTNLKSLDIPSSVTSIDKNVFEEPGSYMQCVSLESINVDTNNPNYSSFDGVLYNKDETELIWCPYAKESITIPSSITKLYVNKFNYVNDLKSINVDENNPEYSSIDGLLYNKDKTELIYCPTKCKPSINIPSTVTNFLTDDMFAHCKDLKSIYVDEDNLYYTSVEGVLYDKYKSSLICCPKCATSVTIPNRVTSIEDYAFSGRKNLTSVTIPNSVTSIGKYAFLNCSALTSVEIPNTVTTINECVFENCTSLTSVTIPNSVTSINYRAFDNCPELKSITIPSSVTVIDRVALGFIVKITGTFQLVDFTIICEKGSAAERYAVNNQINYETWTIMGDVKVDGNIDIEDAVMVINHVNGLKALDDYVISSADIDGNSDIDIEDAVAIIAHVNGVKSLD